MRSRRTALRNIGPRLGLRSGPGLVLRRVLLRLLRMGLGGRARRRRRPRIMLTMNERGTQPGGAERGSQSCPAPCFRLAYAFHILPNLILKIPNALIQQI